jgi:hypothetical protein
MTTATALVFITAMMSIAHSIYVLIAIAIYHFVIVLQVKNAWKSSIKICMSSQRFAERVRESVMASNRGEEKKAAALYTHTLHFLRVR